MTVTERTQILVADTDGMDVDSAYARLAAAGFDVRVLETKNHEAIIAAGQQAQALLVSSVTVPREVLEAMPQLRVVGCMSTGTNHVDVEAATRLGIRVTNFQDASTDAVATHALALTLASLRELPESVAIARSGDWSIRPGVRPLEPQRLTLGVVGLGRIGRRFAGLAERLFARVIGFDVAPPVEGDWITRVPIGELAAEADVISLHVPSTPETRQLVAEGLIPNLGAGTTLINVSRGDLVSRDTLTELLDSGRLRSAALDVLPTEPPSRDDPLLSHPRVIVTPHYGFLSEHTARDYPNRQVDAVLEYFGHSTA